MINQSLRNQSTHREENGTKKNDKSVLKKSIKP